MRENEEGFAEERAETRKDRGGICWIDISIGSWLLGFSLVVLQWLKIQPSFLHMWLPRVPLLLMNMAEYSAT